MNLRKLDSPTPSLIESFFQGGLKGVIWTDVFQGVIMITGMLAFLIKGSLELGGFANVWRVAERGGRIDFVQ